MLKNTILNTLEGKKSIFTKEVLRIFSMDIFNRNVFTCFTCKIIGKQ